MNIDADKKIFWKLEDIFDNYNKEVLGNSNSDNNNAVNNMNGTQNMEQEDLVVTNGILGDYEKDIGYHEETVAGENIDNLDNDYSDNYGKNDLKRMTGEPEENSEEKKESKKSTKFWVDINENDKISDDTVNMLIEKFINKKILSKKTNLNHKTDNLITNSSYMYWNITELIKDKTTNNLNKMLTDKYGYTSKVGKGENIPLAFYFDLSLSMLKHSKLLSLVAVKLMKKNIKILIGYNQKIIYQSDSIKSEFTLKDFKYMMEKELGKEINNNYGEEINQNLDEYLKQKQAEKVVIFSDFDSKDQIINLANTCEVHWFSFENREYNQNNTVNDFRGKYYKTLDINDFANHLRAV